MTESAESVPFAVDPVKSEDRSFVRWVRESPVASGAAAGLVGGIAFGAAMIELGVLSSVASLVRADSPVIGFVVHMAIAAIVGGGLGWLLGRAWWTPGDTVFWSVTYATFFWFLGPITLGPIIRGEVPAWGVAAAQALVPSLLGHVVWGATTGLALIVIRRRGTGGDIREVAVPAARVAPRAFRGAVAGLLAAALLGIVPGGLERAFSPWLPVDLLGATWWAVVIAILAGVVYGVLHRDGQPTAGSALVRGAAYGFLLWVVVGLTILPVLAGAGLPWQIDRVRASFGSLPPTLLLGAGLCLVVHWLERVTRLFFSDHPRVERPDGGSWGPRALVRGAGAGLVGGALFTIVMIQIDYLPTVARLVGSESPLVGLIVHLVIAEVVGASYGLLFRRQTFDVGSALGWGAAYGFVWWILGPLTLGPMILGVTPAWTVEAAATAFPGLIGHLAYGAGLGVAFLLMERRYSPWWISRNEREADLMAQRRREALSAGPALWALLVVLALALPVILSPGA